jgi:hypothetical protein
MGVHFAYHAMENALPQIMDEVHFWRAVDGRERTLFFFFFGF